jgi:DNA-binding Xre family transcriptional regulator
MLNLNIERVMKLRGVESPYRALVSLGFAPVTAKNLLENKTKRIEFRQLERICFFLNCTPNDLIEWQPHEQLANPSQYELIKLKHESSEDMRNLLRSVPIEKFDEIVGIIQNLKSG